MSVIMANIPLVKETYTRDEVVSLLATTTSMVSAIRPGEGICGYNGGGLFLLGNKTSIDWVANSVHREERLKWFEENYARICDAHKNLGALMER